MLARALKLDEEEVGAIACGALLHEIGEVAIREAILRKPAVLDAEERLIMRECCLRGYEMVRKEAFVGTRRRLFAPTASGSTEPAIPRVSKVRPFLWGLALSLSRRCLKCSSAIAPTAGHAHSRTRARGDPALVRPSVRSVNCRRVRELAG